MKKNKAIVHIGTEKTGTTTLQFFLDKNRKKLISQGFYFMRSTGITNDAKLAGYCFSDNQLDFYYFRNNFINTEVKKQNFDAQFVQEFEDELASLPKNVDTVIFSSEFFHSRIITQQQRHKLKSLLLDYFNNVEIVCYIRPQVDVNVSLYSTSLKSGPCTIDVDEHLERCHTKNYYYDYYKLLSSWNEDFPDTPLRVRIFDKKELVRKDLISDFCYLCGMDEEKLERVSLENESVRPTGQELLKIINKKLPVFIEGVGINSLRINLIKIISSMYAGSGMKPSADKARLVQERFSQINNAVKERWFPEKKELFEIDYSKFSNSEEVDWGVVAFFDMFISELSSLDIAKLVGVNRKNIDDLRDTALALENTDVKGALSIMQVAGLLRPEGPFIKKKLNEYRKNNNLN